MEGGVSDEGKNYHEFDIVFVEARGYSFSMVQNIYNFGDCRLNF